MAARKKMMDHGVKLMCPVCGETAAVMNLDLSCMSCTCESCGDTFSPETALIILGAHLERWERIVSWVKSAREALAPVQRDCDALPLPDPQYEDETDTELVAKVFA